MDALDASLDPLPNPLRSRPGLAEAATRKDRPCLPVTLGSELVRPRQEPPVMDQLFALLVS